MLSGKDITIDKDGSIILNGDKYPLASQAEIDAVKDDIEDLGDTIGDITQTGITGATVAAQLGVLSDEIEVKTDVTTDVITLNTGWSFDPGSVNTVKKVGSIAWLSSNIFSDSALTADTLYEVGTLPAGFIPSKDHILPIYGTDSSTLNGVITIGNNGKIKYKAVNTGRYAIYTTIMYPLT